MSYEDLCVTPLIEQLTNTLKDEQVKVEVLVKECSRITPQDGVMILPCVAVSRVESDINAIFQIVKISKHELSISFYGTDIKTNIIIATFYDAWNMNCI